MLTFLIFNLSENTDVINRNDVIKSSTENYENRVSDLSLDVALNKSYYYNDHDAIFSSVPLSSEPSLYLIEWNLQLANLLDLNTNTISDNVKSFLQKKKPQLMIFMS